MSSPPLYIPRRPIGVESEYGFLNKENEALAVEDQTKVLLNLAVAKLPSVQWADNFGINGLYGLAFCPGDRWYLDGNHFEVAGAPCFGARAAALKVRAVNHTLRVVSGDSKTVGEALIRNNIDSSQLNEHDDPITFGSHVNALMTKKGYEQFRLALPCLATLPIISGSGGIVQLKGRFSEYPPYQGAAGFVISPRAAMMDQVFNTDTIKNRSIVTNRDEHHADQDKYRRLHLMPFDALLHDIPEFLKYFIVDMTLRLVECGALKECAMRADDDLLKFDDIVIDMQEICRFMGGKGWNMNFVTPGKVINAVEVQYSYLDLASKLFEDAQTTDGFELWRKVLEKLSLLTGETDYNGFSTDPALVSLYGWCEWATKKYLLDELCRELRRDGCEITFELLASLDIDFSRVHPSSNLFLNDDGSLATGTNLFSAKEIEFASRNSGGGRSDVYQRLIERAPNISDPVQLDWACFSIGSDSFRMPDPFSNYPELQLLIEQKSAYKSKA